MVITERENTGEDVLSKPNLDGLKGILPSFHVLNSPGNMSFVQPLLPRIHRYRNDYLDMGLETATNICRNAVILIAQTCYSVHQVFLKTAGIKRDCERDVHCDYYQIFTDSST